MAEYPPRSCGPCPNQPESAVHEEPRDYLSKNTIPQPNIAYHKQQKLNDTDLGVGGTDIKPDLRVRPVFNKEQTHSGHKVEEHAHSRHKMEEQAHSAHNLAEPMPPCDLNLGIPLPSLPGADPEQRGLIPQGMQVCKDKHTLKSILKKEEGPPSVEALHAASGKHRPAFKIPPIETPSDQRAEPKEQSMPCYLPQPHDALPHPLEEGGMGPVGPWATGRIDWGPMSGLTGTRPVVDKYSLARYSEGDWRAQNKEELDRATMEQHRANLIDWNGRQCMHQTFADVEKNQGDNTRRLNQRELELLRWKCEAQRAIAAAAEEIAFLQEQRQRLKSASKVLNLPERIAGECLERRTGRIESELVRDEVEEEMIKELALCAELRETFARTLADLEAQLMENRTAKERLEYDWSDKSIAHELDSINMAFTSKTTTLMFKPGAVCFPDEQSTEEFWEHFSRETVIEGEATRQRSVTFRSTLNSVLLNAARDLRSQADRVEAALAKRIACNQEMLKRLENDLRMVLRRLADIEELKEALRVALRRVDIAMKTAQTRLDNRMRRPRVENCRDRVHFGLMEEVKSLGDGTAALTAQMNQAQDSQNKLIQSRSDLERQIMMKRKTIEIDLVRSTKIRSFYPSAAALTGQ